MVCFRIISFEGSRGGQHSHQSRLPVTFTIPRGVSQAGRNANITPWKPLRTPERCHLYFWEKGENMVFSGRIII